MRSTLAFLALAACSNAADPATDAPPGSHHDAPPAGSDAADHDAPAGDGSAAPLRLLVINEVAASESPDWFEVVNATTADLELSDFVFVDAKDDLAKAVAFPQMTLGPGAYFAQDVDGTVVPFKLGSDEELWVYRNADGALSDGVDWNEGDSPAGGSYARKPDVFGPFQMSTTQTKGAPNGS